MGQRRPVRGQELETAAELENIAETTERLPLGHVGFEPAARCRPPRWVGLGPSPVTGGEGRRRQNRGAARVARSFLLTQAERSPQAVLGTTHRSPHFPG